LPSHPFFIASQFHPEFQSRPSAPHPLFQGFVQAASNQGKQDVLEAEGRDLVAGKVAGN
ncbi:CTP synthase, partial [Microcoleus sp. herbarium8]